MLQYHEVRRIKIKNILKLSHQFNKLRLVLRRTTDEFSINSLIKAKHIKKSKRGPSKKRNNTHNIIIKTKKTIFHSRMERKQNISKQPTNNVILCEQINK